MKFKLPHFLSRKIDSTDVLIKGKLLTCIILSVISAFIDIVFFSGLSKSGYPFFILVILFRFWLSFLTISFSFSKNMKIISENSENQLFSIPLICLQSLSNDFQKSNFIFSEDQSEKSENQNLLKTVCLQHD